MCASSAERSEGFRNVLGKERTPRGRELRGDDRIVLDEPGEVAEAVLDDGARGDVAWRRRRLRPSQLGTLDRDARHGPDQLRADDDDEAEDDRVAIPPPRRRVDEDRRADDVANDPVDDLDGVLGWTELEDPRLRAVRPREAQPITVEPDHEDLGLDRAVDIPTGRCAAHHDIVASDPRRVRVDRLLDSDP
jgi:hypothetical protein